MRLQYESIVIAGTGAPVAISAVPLWARDVVITATATATITAPNGAIMATLVAGVPYQIPGVSHAEWGDEPQINLGQYSITIAVAETAYVSYSLPRVQFLLNELPGLRIWVSADRIKGLADNDPIATAPDLSGLNNDFTQGTAADRPLFKTNIVAGKPVMRFDGSTDFMSSPYAASDETATEQFFFAVFRTNTVTAQQFILWAGEAAANGYGTESEIHMGVADLIVGNNVVHAHMGKITVVAGSILPFTDTLNFHTIGARWSKLTSNAPTVQVFLDDAVGPIFTNTAPEVFAGWSGNTHLGKPGGAARWFNGDIAEAAVYNAAMWGASTLEFYGRLRAYAQGKYGLG